MFVNRHGLRQTKDNVSRRLKTAIKRANKILERAGIEPLSEQVTPYAFRRTYSSLRAARWIDPQGTVRPGDDPVYIAEQMGHTDANLTFRIYQRAVKRREKLSGAHLRAFDSALEWARIGTNGGSEAFPELVNPASQAEFAG